MEQPKLVKAAGILCAAFGFSGILLLLPNLSMLLTEGLPPELEPIAESIAAPMIIAAVYLPLMAGAGVGLLLFRRWGWWLGMLYAIVAIAGIGIITWLELSALEQAVVIAEQAGASTPTFSWGSKAVSLVVPVFTLYALLKSETREAFGLKSQ